VEAGVGGPPTAVEEPSRRRGADNMGPRQTVEAGRKQGAGPQGGEEVADCLARWLLDAWRACSGRRAHRSGHQRLTVDLESSSKRQHANAAMPRLRLGRAGLQSPCAQAASGEEG
jgi:hypothetical protein